MDLLYEAQVLAAYGWHTFALNPGGKPWANCDDCRLNCTYMEQYEECECLLCHGFYAATTSNDTLAAMWEQQPTSIIGVRTGSRSNMFVLDFDRHEGGGNGIATLIKLKEQGVLPLTVSAKTGGGGYHLFYQYPGGGLRVPNNNRGRVGPGVDVKGEGGFIIAPPSIKEGRTQGYSWYPGRTPWEFPLATLSDPLASLIAQVPDPPRVRSLDTLDVDLTQLTTQDLTKALERLEWVGVGGRNDRLYTAACRAGEAVASGALSLGAARDLLIDKAIDTGLRLHEVHATIRSGLGRGMRDFGEA